MKDIYKMNVGQLKNEERRQRMKLKEIKLLIAKRNRGYLPPERKSDDSLPPMLIL